MLLYTGKNTGENEMRNRRKRILSVIFSACIFLCNIYYNIVIAENISDYGYIFTLKEDSLMLFDNELTEDIDIISDEASIYHADTLQDIKELSKIADIGIIAEDAPIELFEFPDDSNDILYSKQWGHKTSKPAAFWRNGINGEGVKIGIIDTGIQRGHQDFNGVEIGTGINICAVLDKKPDKYYNTDDYNGHGTGVSSVIGAKINNGIGMAGITDKCTIEPLCVYDTASKYNLSVGALLTALEYANKQKCDVINLSLGFKNPSDNLIQITNELIDKIASDGTIIIAASGNDGRTSNITQYPAACDKVIGVGGIMQDGNGYKKAESSTANNTVWVSAPGDAMVTANIDRDSPYVVRGGTSFSAPMVAAAAIGAKQMNPDINADIFKVILKETAIDIEDEGYDINTGYGMIDFGEIYNYILNMSDISIQPTSVPVITPTVKPDIGALESPRPGESMQPDIVATAIPTILPGLTIDIEANVYYSEECNQWMCTIENTTDTAISATAIIAVYKQNGTLKALETIKEIPCGTTDRTIKGDITDGDMVKVFVWEDLQSMKPYANYKITGGVRI